MVAVAVRVLAAVRFFDRAAGSTVTAPLRVEANDALGVRNRSGLWVIRAATGVPNDAPDSIAPRSVNVQARVFDPSGRYLPRAFTVAVPRVPSAPEHLFDPVTIDLPPSPAAPVRYGWASVRVSLRFAASASAPDGTPIEGALVRLTSDELGLRCQTLSDARGEALLIGPGIRPFSAAEGGESVVEPASPHQLDVVVDRAATDLTSGRRNALADPDALWSARSSLVHVTRSTALAANEHQSQVFDVPRS